MPDLDSLQVEVEIHETKVKLVKPEMEATVEIQDRRFSGHVVSVAGQASQTGWWDGNIRRFKTIVELHEHSGLKPGMSAEVEIRIAEHDNVLTIPLAAVVNVAESITAGCRKGIRITGSRSAWARPTTSL